MIKYIRALFLLIPLSLHSMEQNQPIVLTGLRNVTHYIAVPCGLSKLKALSPSHLEVKMFEHLKNIALVKSSATLPEGPYPPLVKAWLTNLRTSKETRDIALKNISLWHPIIRQTADIGFNPPEAVKAFTPHQPTIDIFSRLVQPTALALCANFNTELHEELHKKFPLFFKFFIAEYISGDSTMLTTDPRFYVDIIKAYGQDNCYFIDAEEETITAAHEAGMPEQQTLLYNCTDKDASQTLATFLADHHLISQQESLH